MRKIGNIFAAFAVIVMVSACGPKMTTTRSNPKCLEAISCAKHAIILPPEVSANSQDSSGNLKKLHNYEYQLEETITEVLTDILKEKNIPVRNISRRDIHDMKASRKILAFREDFQDNIKKLYDKDFWPEEKAFAIDTKLSQEIRDFQKQTKADLIFMVEYFSKAKTRGAKTMDFASGMALALVGAQKQYDPKDSDEYVEVRLSIIDARDYRILWAQKNWAGYGSMFTGKDIKKTDTKRMKKMFAEMLKDISKK